MKTNKNNSFVEILFWSAAGFFAFTYLLGKNQNKNQGDKSLEQLRDNVNDGFLIDRKNFSIDISNMNQDFNLAENKL